MLSVDQERRRIALGMKQLNDDPWATNIPAEVPARPDRQGSGHEDHQFRRLRRPGRRPGGPAAHLGVGGPQGRQPRGRGQGRRGDRGQGPARRCRRAEDRPLAEAGRVGRGGGGGEGQAGTPAKPQPSTPPAELKGGVGGGSGPLIAPRLPDRDCPRAVDPETARQ